jgi:hypothetical protein
MRRRNSVPQRGLRLPVRQVSALPCRPKLDCPNDCRLEERGNDVRQSGGEIRSSLVVNSGQTASAVRVECGRAVWGRRRICLKKGKERASPLVRDQIAPFLFLFLWSSSLSGGPARECNCFSLTLACRAATRRCQPEIVVRVYPWSRRRCRVFASLPCTRKFAKKIEERGTDVTQSGAEYGRPSRRCAGENHRPPWPKPFRCSTGLELKHDT